MKNQFQIFSLLMTCLVIAACPYETNIPIDAPSVNINPGILGAWGSRENTNEIYTISKQDEYTYRIEITEEESMEKEIYLAYVSLIKKTTFLNVSKYRADQASPAYLLYKMDMEGENQIILSEVTDNIDETFSSGSELKKYIGKNMKNSYFFGKDETVLTRL